jgi:dimethylargininase
MLVAITRAISPRFNECELTHLSRAPIDLDRARTQHRQYEQALGQLGIQIHRLPAEPDMPDAVFVEDTALVLDELAIVACPGAAIRRAETVAVERALAPYRPVRRITLPGMLDGGDVLCLDKTLYVGISSRSNGVAVEQLQDILQPYGYSVRAVPITGCLHLKSAVTQAGEGVLVINSAWVDRTHFPGWTFIEVAPEEPSAANALYLPTATLYPTHFVQTRKRLEAANIPLLLVDATEIAKAEGAVTCCSLIFQRKEVSAPCPPVGTS